MSPKRTGMHFLFCFVDLALIAPNIRWIRRFSAAAQHLIMVHFNLSPLKVGKVNRGFIVVVYGCFSFTIAAVEAPNATIIFVRYVVG